MRRSFLTLPTFQHTYTHIHTHLRFNLMRWLAFLSLHTHQWAWMFLVRLTFEKFKAQKIIKSSCETWEWEKHAKSCSSIDPAPLELFFFTLFSSIHILSMWMLFLEALKARAEWKIGANKKLKGGCCWWWWWRYRRWWLLGMDGLKMRMRELECSMKLLLLSLCFFCHVVSVLVLALDIVCLFKWKGTNTFWTAASVTHSTTLFPSTKFLLFWKKNYAWASKQWWTFLRTAKGKKTQR